MATRKSTAIQNSDAPKYQTLTYRWSTLRFARVNSAGRMIIAKPAKMKMSICHGISRNSIPSDHPEATAPMPAATPALMKAPPSIAQLAPRNGVRSRRGSSQTITARQPFDAKP